MTTQRRHGLIDSCITQLKAQGPSRTCNESKEEESHTSPSTASVPGPFRVCGTILMVKWMVKWRVPSDRTPRPPCQLHVPRVNFRMV